MPVHTNSIGDAIFYDLIGTIYSPQQQVEIIERPGVSGSGARLTGSRGKPFDLISTTYHTNFSAAQDAMEAYVTLKTSLQYLVRNTIEYGLHIVLDVAEASPPFAVVNVAGASGAE